MEAFQTLNEVKARMLLKSYCDTSGGVPEWSRVNKYTKSYINGVLDGKLDITDELAQKLGIERVSKGLYRVKAGGIRGCV